MLTTNAVAGLGALIGDPARTSMLVALMDGRALTATELAAIAGVTPQTASSHLGQLVEAGMLTVERQGRHRYHRLATAEVARMVEGMMAVAATLPGYRSARTRAGPKDHAIRQARTCYDHLAGRIAVGIADAMVTRGDIIFSTDGGELTASGMGFLSDIGISVSDNDGKAGRKRVFCRPCLDWSERRWHIAGSVGAMLLQHLISQSWVRLTTGSRAVTITQAGQRHLTDLFGLRDSFLA